MEPWRGRRALDVVDALLFQDLVIKTWTVLVHRYANLSVSNHIYEYPFWVLGLVAFTIEVFEFCGKVGVKLVSLPGELVVCVPLPGACC